MNALDRLLSPLNSTGFLSESLSHKSLHIKGSSDKFEGLFSWGELSRILEQHRLSPPQMRLVQKGKATEDLEFLKRRKTSRGDPIPFLDVPQLYRHLRGGASLVLDAIDEMSKPVEKLCEELSTIFGAHFSVNAYAAWGNEEGFGLHWDDHDVFVIQVAGRKKWELYGFGRSFPLETDVAGNVEPPNDLVWERVVAPGDVIYIPRGHWHCATALNEPTLHLTFGFITPTAIDWLQWVIDEMRIFDDCRKDIPVFSVNDIEAYQAKILERLNQALSEKTINKFLSYRKAKNVSRIHLSLPDAGLKDFISIDDQTHFKFTGISYSTDLRDTASEFYFESLGRRWTVSLEAKEFVLCLLQGKILSFGEIQTIGKSQGMSVEAIKKLLDVMLVQGLIFIIDSQTS